MPINSVIVIGAGIAGLTSAALLAKEGAHVQLLEAHNQPGGCAGTFKRGRFVFDVGATQVAGFERGGIHERLFRHLKISLPEAEVLDRACLVDLGDGLSQITLWHDYKLWEKERRRHFPGTDQFWDLCTQLHEINWAFVKRGPVLTPRNSWDLGQLLKALRPETMLSLPLIKSSVTDLLKLTGCEKDTRLLHFLDLQLKLYSQEPANRTAALYGATVLQMAHKPLGLWHLKGSMQNLSNSLLSAFKRDGGQTFFRHRVVSLKSLKESGLWEVQVITPDRKILQFQSEEVVCTLPPQCLLNLLPSEGDIRKSYLKQLSQLPQASGALVFYGALERSAIPAGLPSHIQLSAEAPGPLFISISREGDGRAPLGQATVIASAFTSTFEWCSLPDQKYQKQKRLMQVAMTRLLEKFLEIPNHQWLHQEMATPRSFARWTGRPHGIVGGLGQNPSQYGPFGLSSRTPLKGLWLCGDCIHPGEGTAGVSQSALLVIRQLLAQRGVDLHVDY